MRLAFAGCRARHHQRFDAALNLQILQIIYRLFRWKDGEYNFEPHDTVEYDRENVTPMAAESILMEGIRMLDEWPIIEKKIPSFDKVFEKIPLPTPPLLDTRADVPALPDMATAISGKTIRLEENPFEIEHLRLVFDNTSAAGFQVTFSDGAQSPLAAVGFDGIYRLTPGMNLDRAFHGFADFQDLSVGLRGHWVDAQTFLLEYDTVVNYYAYELQLHFEGDRVIVSATERGNSNTATFSGRLQSP